MNWSRVKFDDKGDDEEAAFKSWFLTKAESNWSNGTSGTVNGKELGHALQPHTELETPPGTQGSSSHLTMKYKNIITPTHDQSFLKRWGLCAHVQAWNGVGFIT